MSVYIPGMEMPIDCCDCPMSGDYKMCCSLMPGVPALYAEFWDAIKTNRRHKDCPLISVPEHGDLIDRDALTDAIESTDWYHQAPNKEMVHGANSAEHQAWYKEQDIYSAIDDTPTIIPADKEGEG